MLSPVHFAQELKNIERETMRIPKAIVINVLSFESIIVVYIKNVRA